MRSENQYIEPEQVTGREADGEVDSKVATVKVRTASKPQTFLIEILAQVLLGIEAPNYRELIVLSHEHKVQTFHGPLVPIRSEPTVQILPDRQVLAVTVREVVAFVLLASTD